MSKIKIENVLEKEIGYFLIETIILENKKIVCQTEKAL
jgi:hypothetical protein